VVFYSPVNSSGALGCQLYLAENAKNNEFTGEKWQIFNKTITDEIIH